MFEIKHKSTKTIQSDISYSTFTPDIAMTRDKGKWWHEKWCGRTKKQEFDKNRLFLYLDLASSSAWYSDL